MKNRIIIVCTFVLLGYGCSTSNKIVRPEPSQRVDSVNFSKVLDPPENWHELDEKFSRYRGISSQLLYKNYLDKKKPKRQIVVAVLDGGVDINHEDLKQNIWVNEDEIPGNNKDDDKNGYVDDVHGWNFIGGADGQNVDNDTFEVTRIYVRLRPKYNHVDTTSLGPNQIKQYKLYQKVKKEYRIQINKQLRRYENVRSLQKSMQQADEILKNHFGGSYSYEEVQKLQPSDRQTAFAKNVMSYVMKNDIDSTVIAEQKKNLYDFAKYGYNPGYTSRTIVGDDYEDKTEKIYGNNDVAGPGPFHGTHVAGIIGAVRKNGIGMDGIAGDVRIMPIRVVPNGDERDKDIANGIRYAVDNGADIINMSFGKSYSPYKNVVDKAVKYADDHGVLMIHAAGNSSEDNDQKENYPTATYGDYFNGTQKAKDWITVGASSWKPGKNFVATFSNYGKNSVDLFAPGVDIYSTVPGNKYKREDGTSMAAPVVSGAAALLMSYYPKLTASQVRTILINSVKKYPGQKVRKPNGHGKMIDFNRLSASGGEINIFSAFQEAQEVSK